MPATYRVTHQFFGGGGTSDDFYVNQFYLFSTTHLPADAATWGPTLAASLHQLWVYPLSAGNSISRYYHPRCRGNMGATKVYDATGAPATLGAPIFQINDSALGLAGDYLEDSSDEYDGLPEEVAICLSYQAEHTEGDLPRRRGRIYLGPLNTLVLNAGAGPYPSRINDPVLDVITNAAVQTRDILNDGGFTWRVFSTRDGFAFDIINFSADNAFDTIRGRGGAPTSRTTVPIL